MEEASVPDGVVVALPAQRVNVALVEELLWVGSVDSSDLQACAWPLLKCIFGAPGDKCGFFSLVHEEDGITLIMDARCNAAFADVAHLAPVSYAPGHWRAFEIHLGTLAWEVPGVICFLSTAMAGSGISILNHSTYDRDFLLVRESDVARATAVIREALQHGNTDVLREEIEKRRHSNSPSKSIDDDGSDGVDEEMSRELSARAEIGPRSDGAGAGTSGSAGAGAGGAAGGAAGSGGAMNPYSMFGEVLPNAPSCGALSALRRTAAAAVQRELSDLSTSPASSSSVLNDLERDRLFIKVLGARLAVVRLQVGMLQPCTSALLKRLLFSRQPLSSGVVIGEAAQNSARAVDREPDARETGRGRSSFWSYTHTECDVSLIIDQRSLADFPPGAVLGEPTCWRAVKLCGRRFEFDETGVVSAMFAPYKQGVPLLNVSTFATNVTLVEDKDLDRALSAFEDELDRLVEESYDDDGT